MTERDLPNAEGEVESIAPLEEEGDDVDQLELGPNNCAASEEALTN